MDITTLAILIAIIGLGTYVQTVIGFGLGMIVMGVVSYLSLLSLPFTSVIISIMAFSSGILVIKDDLHALNTRSIIFTCAGLIPAVGLGLFILDYMSASMANLLQFILGTAIIIGAAATLLKPEPISQVSHPLVFFIAGAVGGLLAGLFSVAGPPIIYQYYRQPFDIKTIRLCLLFVFLVSSFIRTVMVGVQGNLELDMFLVALYCLPAAYLATWLGKHRPPAINPPMMRKIAITLLVVIGSSLIFKSYSSVWLDYNLNP